MKTIKELAIERGAFIVTNENKKEVYGLDVGLLIFTELQLTAFAEAYHKAKMEDAPVVAYIMPNDIGRLITITKSELDRQSAEHKEMIAIWAKAKPLIQKDGE